MLLSSCLLLLLLTGRSSGADTVPVHRVQVKLYSCTRLHVAKRSQTVM